MRSTKILLLVLCGLAPALFLARAQAAESSGGEARLREALRSTTSQLRALEDERAAWKAKEAEQQRQLEALRKEASVKSAPRAAARDRKLDRILAAQAEEKAAESARLGQSLAQCQSSSREVAAASEAAGRERTQLAADNQKLAERVKVLEARNAGMYRVGREILDWLSRQGVGAALAAREQFLGLKRVELENAAQQYEDKLLEQKVQP
jgi:hypothetical protein